MCFSSPKPPKDNSGEIARAEEQARQGRITQGQTAIDTTLAPYTPEYFGGLTKAYTDNYFPELDRQRNETIRKLTLQLARSGNLQGSSGQRQLGEVQRLYGTNRQQIADQGLAAAGDARSRMEAARSDLYTQNRAAADPSSAGASAARAASDISRPPTYSPLGDVFASVMNNFAQANRFEAAGFPGYRTGLFLNPSNASSRVVA